MKKQDMTDESSSVSLKEREITAMELTAIRGRKVLPASLAALYAGVGPKLTKFLETGNIVSARLSGA